MSSFPQPTSRPSASPATPRKTMPLLQRGVSAGSFLPPPPNVTTQKQPQSNYAQSLARSMTIEEMRDLHRRALSDAEAKQTELRLVLASRYRELVGSSDEVTKMRERALELHELVDALPGLMDKLIRSSEEPHQESKSQEGGDQEKISAKGKVLSLRRDLSNLPRLVHRALDKNDVHEATESLMQLFRLIAQQTVEYPLATALASGVVLAPVTTEDSLLQAQMRMTFLHVQTLPAKINRISKYILNSAASFGLDDSAKYGAHKSASALSTLDLLDINQLRDRPVQLLDLYFDSKAKLLQSLLTKLTSSQSEKEEEAAEEDDETLALEEAK